VSIEFVCHNCGRELKVHQQAIGRRVRCPGCESLVLVPKPAELEAEQEESDETPAQPAAAEEQPEQPVTEQATQVPAKHVESTQLPPKLPFEAAGPPANVTPPPIATPVIRQQPKPQAKPKAKATPSEDPPLILPPQAHQEDLIDMTAMVDIVFFLLIFFMVTSLQALEAVMNMPTPQAAEGGAATSRSVADLENDPNYITVRIEDDDSIWVEDTQVFNDQELAMRLRAARKESEGSRSLLVIGDADASHGAAVRVFDAGAGAGVNGISLVIQEKGEGR
jgi:biopolymer transport protein ExbD